MPARKLEAIAPVPLSGERPRRVADLINHEFLAEIGYDAATMVLRLPSHHHLLGHNVCPIPGCNLLAAPYTGQLCATCYGRWKRVLAEPGMTFDIFKTIPRDSNRRPELAQQIPVFHLGAYPPEMRDQLLALISLQRNSGRQGMAVLIRSMLQWIDRQQIISLDDPRFVLDVNGKITHGRGGLQKFRKTALAELHLALTRPEDEEVKDYWNLRVFGYPLGFLNFRGGHQQSQSRLPVPELSQRWLRETAKEFAYSAMLPQHLEAGSMQSYLRSVAHLSAVLALRDDHGEDPSQLSHADIEAFLIRLNQYATAGTISNSDHFRYIVQARRFIDDVLGLGLDRPGQSAAGLGPGFRFRHTDRVRLIRTTNEDEVAGDAIPDIVMEQLLSKESLEILATCSIAGQQATRMIQVLADVGRRPGEVCALAFECLEYEDSEDESGQTHRSPVLVYDMPKTKWAGRRLPIHASTAAIIRAQQDHVRAQFPHTPTAELALWPRLNRNPRGVRRITSTYLFQVITRWMKAIPQIQGPDIDAAGRPMPFDHSRVFAYCRRTTSCVGWSTA